MEHIVTICFASLLSFLLCKVFIRFSQHLKALNQSNDSVTQYRWAGHAKPLVGGVAFFLVFVAALLFYYTTTALAPGFLPGLTAAAGVELHLLLPLILVATLGFFIGLADDAFNTKPFVKFAGQFACGAILIAFGITIDLFDIWWLDWPLTMLWVVGIMNSINMLDNMDGVTGSVSLGIFGTASVWMLVAGGGWASGPLFFISLCMVGALIGYLFLNWHPSKLFMGDTGSQFLGAVLAFYGIYAFWDQPTQSGDMIFMRQFIMGVLAFLMPIIDTSFVTVVRLRRGQSPFVGGRDHTTHHLNYVGVSQRVIPIVTLAVTVLSGALVVLSYEVLTNWSFYHTALYAGYIGMMYAVFFVIYRRGQFIYHLREARKARDLKARLAAVEAAQQVQIVERVNENAAITS